MSGCGATPVQGSGGQGRGCARRVTSRVWDTVPLGCLPLPAVREPIFTQAAAGRPPMPPPAPDPKEPSELYSLSPLGAEGRPVRLQGSCPLTGTEHSTAPREFPAYLLGAGVSVGHPPATSLPARSGGRASPPPCSRHSGFPDAQAMGPHGVPWGHDRGLAFGVSSYDAWVGHPFELPLTSAGEVETSVPTGPLSGSPRERFTPHPCPSWPWAHWATQPHSPPEKLPGLTQAVWYPGLPRLTFLGPEDQRLSGPAPRLRGRRLGVLHIPGTLSSHTNFRHHGGLQKRSLS